MSGEAAPLAVLNALLDDEAVGVRCEDGAIVEIGPDVAPKAGDEIIEARNARLAPTMVNGHTHAAMTLFRGYGGDLPLMRWLREMIWPVEAKLDDEDVYWGTRLACLEMIRTGTGCFWDMYWRPTATARAVEDAGLRATIGGPLFDADGDTAGMQTKALRDLEALRSSNPRVGRALAPHSIYTVSEDLLRWTAEQSAEQSLPVQIHLSETEQEVSDCLAAHGVRPAFYLDRLGLLCERTVLAHGVWLEREELELIAARGCTVVTNPVANMKLAVGGVFPYPEAHEAGVSIGLGTDGAGSNDSLDLFSDLKVLALIQRQTSGDPAVLPATEALEIATGMRSNLLRDKGRPPLSPGAPADFLLLRRDAYELGLGDLASDLVYAANGSIVDTTVVSGRPLMRDGAITGQEEIVAKAAERALQLGIG